MSQYENIGIAYFTNPALQNEPFGKEVEGIMISVGKQIHTWGSVDQNSPLDNASPYDYYYIFSVGTE